MGDDRKSSGDPADSRALLCCCRTGNNHEDLPDDGLEDYDDDYDLIKFLRSSATKASAPSDKTDAEGETTRLILQTTTD